MAKELKAGQKEELNIGKIEQYGHGGDVWTAAKAFGGQAEAFLDYSANINPLGPPSCVQQALQQSWERMLQYPDPGHRKMKGYLAERLGVEPEYLLIGNGAAECMALALLYLKPTTVGVIAPCFSEYEALSKQFDAKVIAIRGSKELDYQAPAEELLKLAAERDVCFVGHPNNPTGVLYSSQVLTEAANLAAEKNHTLIVDEAFIDFLDEDEAEVNSLYRLCENNRHLIVLRSLTKFYAIPGLRLGYAIAHPSLIEGMKDKQVTWSVNGLALAAGEALFDPKHREEVAAYEEETRTLIVKEREWLRAELRVLGLETWPSQANFLLCHIETPWTAASLQQALGGRGILIRSCAMYEGLQDGHFRLAVKDHSSNERLIHTLRQVLAEEQPSSS